MNTYVVLLRGINVSGKNLMKMTDLKQLLLINGFCDVVTYIQSGNIVLKSMLSAQQIERTIHELIATHFQLSIAVFVLTVNDIKTALTNNPFANETPTNRVFITFINQVPAKELVDALTTVDFGQDQFHIQQNVLYFYLPEGMAKSKMTNNFFEKKLKVTATGRNLNTIQKIIELSNE